MAEGKSGNKGKKKKAGSRPANVNAKNGGEEAQSRLSTDSVGDILRTTRLEKGVGLEDVSAVINVRVSQLRAIEEGNIDALPGMTYALGFVRSYAGYLELNGADIVQKFKAEHGGMQPANQHLHMPEPIADGPQPNIMVIGAAVFCAVLVLVLWTVFSGGDDADVEAAGYIPPAPVVGTVTGISSAPPSSVAAGSKLLGPEAGGIAPAAPSVLASPSPVAPAVNEAPSAPQAEAAPPQQPAPATPEARQPATPAQAAPAATAEQAVPAAKPQEKPLAEDRVINVRRGKGRVVLEAKQSSWVEIRDAEGQSVFKKVLREGEKYYVPDQPGLSMVTSNAGGLDIYVDGEKVQSIGRSGEIVRGVELAPEKLKITRIRNRDRR